MLEMTIYGDPKIVAESGYIFPNLGKWTVYTDEDGEMDGLLYL